jgi:hypothetical protein
MSEHRHITVTADEFDDIDAALAWVVSTLDREFADADMPKISIEQIMRAAGDSDDGKGGLDWRYVWCASIAGSFPVTTRAGATP